eukprot:tig00021721_g23220.t1
MPPISNGEREYIVRGAEMNLRSDGRGCLDYRSFSIETGLLAQANGSARVRLARTDVLVGVKAEIAKPAEGRPDRGMVACAVECCPTASAEFQGRQAEEINAELTRVLEQQFEHPSALDYASLSIQPGRTCWVLFIDALVLAADGNLADAISVAARAALSNTRVPKIELVPGDRPGEMEIEVSDDPHEAAPVGVASVPLCVTLHRIGSRYVADATREEEACSTARVTVGVDGEGQVCAMHKLGAGALDPASLEGMLQTARRLGAALIKALDACLAAERRLADAPKVAFLS